MSSTFAIVGSGSLGSYLIEEFLTHKASGSVTTLKIISRSVSLQESLPPGHNQTLRPLPPNCPTDEISPSSLISQETIKSTNPEWFSKGAELAKVNYADESSIVAAFKGIDVVISTLGVGVVDQQDVLARAAKAAGVKLFVPSEYGVTTENATSGPLLIKKKFAESLKEINLPYVKIFTGLWTDYCLAP